MYLLDDVTQRINLEVALWARRRERATYLMLFREALAPDPDPADAAAYLRALFDGWGLLLFPALLVMIAVALVGHKLDGSRGNVDGFGIGLFFPVACLAGQLDALWRYATAKRARRLDSASSEAHRARAQRLLQIAQFRDGTLVLQLLAASAATLITLTH